MLVRVLVTEDCIIIDEECSSIAYYTVIMNWTFNIEGFWHSRNYWNSDETLKQFEKCVIYYAVHGTWSKVSYCIHSYRTVSGNKAACTTSNSSILYVHFAFFVLDFQHKSLICIRVLFLSWCVETKNALFRIQIWSVYQYNKEEGI